MSDEEREQGKERSDAYVDDKGKGREEGRKKWKGEVKSGNVVYVEEERRSL